MAAITTAHRWLYAPVDEAYFARGQSGAPALGVSPLPAIVTLGKGDGAIALLRFAITLPPETTLLEAYLILPRATDVDADPEPIALHAARVTDPWDGASVTWSHPPRIVEVGAPVTRVAPSTTLALRLDVREIVQRWRRRPEGEFGIAVVTDGGRQSATGVAFALAPVPRSAAGPELELYVK